MKPLFKATIVFLSFFISYQSVRAKDTGHTLDEHIVPLENSSNFRDIGGYKTTCGKRIRHGKVYRSGAIHNLSDNDLAMLEALDLKVIIDLRTSEERKIKPDKIPATVDRFFFRPAYDKDPGDFPEHLLQALDATGSLNRYKNQSYATIISSGTSSFREIFLQAATGDTLLFHCAGGQDRTGIAAAILLLALGVGRETVMDDYMMTNEAKRRNLDKTGLLVSEPELLSTITQAYEEHLESALERINGEFGGIQCYLHEQLGINSQILNQVYNLLLY